MESRIFLTVATYAEYRGVNAQDDFSPGSCVTQAKAWGTSIIRESVHAFDQAIFGSGWNSTYNTHGLQDIATANTNAGVITIFCPFSWGWSEIRNYSPSGTGSNSFDSAFGSGSWTRYNSQLTAMGRQFAGQSSVWLEVWNEPYDWSVATDPNTWLLDMETMVSSIRNGGFTGKIVIPGGQNAGAEDVIVSKGMTLLNYDPNHNLIFDIHAYNSWFDSGQAGMANRIDNVLNSGVQMIFGEFGAGTSGGMYDVAPFLAAAQSRHVGAVAWSWNYGDGSAVVLSDGSTPNDTAQNYNYGTKVKNYLSGARATLPSGWSDSDIGGPTLAGGAGYDSSTATWNVSGSGADIWNGSDQFSYLSQGVSGNQTIVARVTSVRNTDGWAKSGVMFRNGTAANAMFAGVFVTPSNGLAFQWRSTAGATPSNVGVTGVAAPTWVKLVRSGNTFSAYYSSNGSSWTQIGANQSIGMASSYRAGLAVTAHTNSNINISSFTNVSVGNGVSIPFNQTIGIRADNGLYVSNNQNSSPQGLIMANWATSIGSWEQFTVVDAGGGLVEIKSNLTGDYLSVDPNNGYRLRDVGTNWLGGTWEPFQWVWVDQASHTFALKSTLSGYYVSADMNNGGQLTASWATTIGSWETFSF